MSPPPGQSQPIDPTAMAEAFAAALQRNAPQPAPQQMSPEQIDQMLRTYRPGQDLIEQLFGDTATAESRMQALQGLVQGVVANATAHAQVLADNYIQQYHASVSPHLDDARELSQERFYQSLYEGAPGLKQYDPVVKQFLPQLQQDPQYPKDRGQRAAWVRDKVSGVLKQSNPQFDPAVAPSASAGQQSFGTSSSRPSQPQGQTPSLPALAAGASGGSTSSPQGSGGAAKMGFSL